MSLAQTSSSTSEFPLYAGAAPGSGSWTWGEERMPDTDGIARIRNISKPTLTVYRAPKPNGTVVIVCPGGGFRILAIDHEGHEVARWLNTLGVTALVLKYRVMRTGDAGEKDKAEMARRRDEAIGMGIADAKEAVRVVRSRAAELGMKRVGIMGFSAGGCVTAGAAVSSDPATRPDFAAPIYAYIPEGIRNQAQPIPLFLVHADDDKTVPPQTHSVPLYLAWKAANAPVEMHIYSKGGHGFGMRKKDLPVDAWTARMGEWMQAQGLLG